MKEDQTKKPVAVSDGPCVCQDRRVVLAWHESPEDRMTRLEPGKTGLPMHINMSVAQLRESPCIKVNRTTRKQLPDLKDMFSVTIPADPFYEPLVHGDSGEITKADMQKVFKFIVLNRETLLVSWYQLDGCALYMKSIKSIRGQQVLAQ